MAAWSIRWEKGEEINKDNTKFVYYSDRWLGQTWVKIYNIDGYQMKPSYGDNVINNELLDIYSKNPNLLIQLADYDKQIDQASTQTMLLQNKLNQFENLGIKYGREWTRITYPDWNTFMVNAFGGNWITFYRTSGSSDYDMVKYVKAKMPTDIWEAGESYYKYRDEQASLEQEKWLLWSGLQQKATDNVQARIVSYNKIATYSWFALSGLTTLWLLSFFWSTKRKGVED